jgi:hypothetical protein
MSSSVKFSLLEKICGSIGFASGALFGNRLYINDKTVAKWSRMTINEKILVVTGGALASGFGGLGGTGIGLLTGLILSEVGGVMATGIGLSMAANVAYSKYNLGEEEEK